MGKERGYSKICEEVDISASYTSEWVVVSSTDNAFVGVKWDSSDAIGTFYIDIAIAEVISLINQPSFRNVISGNALSYVLNAATATEASWTANLTQIGGMLLRVRYVPTSGTGTFSASMYQKSAGS